MKRLGPHRLRELRRGFRTIWKATAGADLEHGICYNANDAPGRYPQLGNAATATLQQHPNPTLRGPSAAMSASRGAAIPGLSAACIWHKRARRVVLGPKRRVWALCASGRNGAGQLGSGQRVEQDAWKRWSCF